MFGLNKIFIMRFDRVLWQQSLILLSVFVNTLIYGCAGSWISNAIIFLTKPQKNNITATTEQCSIMAQLFEAGRLIFALPAGLITEKLGRKKILVSVGGINFLSWLILSLSNSVIFIYISRFLMGVSGALLYVSSYSTIGEMASPHYRGTLTGINEVANMLGQLFESIVTVIFNSYFYLTNLTTVLASLFFVTVWWLIESPYHLTNISNYDLAKNNLKKLRPGYSDYEIDSEFQLLKQAIEIEKANESKMNWLNFYKYKSIRKPLQCALLLNIVAVSCGGPVMALYVAVMLPTNQYVPNRYYPFISFAIQFIASFGSTFIIDKFSRKKLYLFSAFVSAGMQIFSVFSYIVYISYDSEFWKLCFIVNNFLYMFIDRGLISVLNCTVRSEIFPHNIKGIGNALCVICQSVSLILCYNIYDVVLPYGIQYNYAIFTLNSLILASIIYLFLPETGGKSLIEVQNEIKANINERKSINANKN